MINTQKFNISTYYGLIVVLLPILSVYGIAGGLVDLDVIAMLILLIWAFFKPDIRLSRCRPSIFILLLYIICITTFNVISGPRYADVSSVVLRCGRFCLYMYLVFSVGLYVFNYEKTMRIYRVVAFLALGYIAMQTAAYYTFGITLPNKIGGISEVVNSIGEVGRFRAFYSEPAALVYSLLPFVAISLFGKEYLSRGSRVFDAVLVSVAIVLSTSSQGIIGLAVIWGLWLLNSMRSGLLSAKRVLGIFAIVCLLLGIWRTGLISYSLNRVSSGIGQSSGAVAARASGYVTLSMLNSIQKIFGVGYGNYIVENIYGLKVPYLNVNYSSIAEHLFTTGIIGSLLLLAIFIKRFFYGDKLVKVLFIVMLVLSIMGCPMSGKFFPLYLTFAFGNVFEDNTIEANYFGGGDIV